MAEFVVNTDQLRSNADRIAALQRELDSGAVRLGAMQRGSVLQIKASTALIARVGDCKWAAVHQSDNLGRLARGLDDIALIYDNTEKNLTEPKTQSEATAEAGGSGSGAGSGTAEGNSNILETIAELLEVVGENCPPIGLLAAVARCCEGDAVGYTNALKNLVSAVGNAADGLFCQSGVPAWKGLLGLYDDGAASIGDAAQKFLDDMSIGKQANAAGKVATICKWAGYALTVVSEGFENYEENGLSLRFVAETTIESGVSIGLSIGAGILAAAALGPTAPAILVGAVGAGAVWVVDSVVEWATGQDIGEWVSDGICGAVEWVGDGIQAAGEWVGEGIEAAGEWAGDAIENAGEWVGDRLEDAGNAIEDAGEWVGDRLEDAGNAIEDIGESIGDGVDSVCSWVGGLFS